MTNNKLNVLVLAAGKGTRMKSSLPKVLHRVSGTPMVFRVLKTISRLKPKSIGIVTGHMAKELESEIKKAQTEATLPSTLKLEFLRQNPPKGSGHAVMISSRWVKRNTSGELLILCADTPLISEETLKN